MPTSRPDDEPIGLLAGAGRMPLLVAQGVQRAGRRLAVVGLRGSVDRTLEAWADRFTLAGPTRLGTVIRAFQRWHVRRAVMIGHVNKGQMYSPARLVQFLPDVRTARIWYGKLRGDKRDNAVLLAVADELAGEGIELIDSTTFCREHLAGEGVMTRRAPSPEMRADAEFGWRIARQSAALDIGQALAVKERDIIAVEAIEGTSRMIRRAGELCRVGGWTLVKVARPDQDMRFDVPTIGPETLRLLHAAGGRGVVVEAGRTLIVDKPQTLALADELGLCVMGRRADGE